MNFDYVKAIWKYEKEKDFHQHVNGGGWVANTASVPDDVAIPEGAIVGRDARVGEGARVGRGARVGEGASVGRGARVGPNYSGPILCIQASSHPITTADGVNIGCHKYDIGYWLKHYKAIGRKENYTPKQIEEYGILLKVVEAWLVLVNASSSTPEVPA